MSIARESFFKVVALGDCEMENEVEVVRHLVESTFLEVDAHRRHVLCLPRLTLSRVAETGRSEHGVALGGQGGRERAGHPSGDASDEDALSSDRFHGSYQS